MLYVVATPIGNLGDISPRALATLKDVDFVIAEDTRHTLKLLNHYHIRRPLIPCHQHTHDRQLDRIVSRLHQESAALVSDAGTPGISDPGAKLVSLAVSAGIPVTPIPGASAAISALSASGFAFDQFVFVGFLPQAPKAQLKLVSEVLKPGRAVVLYESAQRLGRTIANLEPALKYTQILVARELTKTFEEIKRGAYNDIVAWLNMGKVRGEITIILYGQVKHGHASKKTRRASGR